MWVMDRASDRSDSGRDAGPGAHGLLLVGTSKSKIKRHEKKWLDLPWQKVRDSVEVKLFEQDGELYVLAKSEAARRKSRHARKRLARLLRKLRAMRRSLPGAISCCCGSAPPRPRRAAPSAS